MKPNIGSGAPVQTPIQTPIQKYLQKHTKGLALLAVLFAANIALQTLAPEALSRFVDAAKTGGGVFGQVGLMILLYLAALILQTVASLFVEYISQSVGLHITDDYRKDVMTHFLKIGMDQHSRWKSGEIMTRLDEDVNGVFQYYYILLFKLVGSGALLLCVLAALAFRSGILCAALFALSAAAILVFKWIQDRGIAKYVRSSEASAEFNGTMKEMVDNAVEIRAFGAEEYSARTMLSAMQKRYRESLPAGLMYGNLWSAATVLLAVSMASALTIGIYLWSGGSATLGVVYLIYTYTTLIQGPLQDFRNHMGQLQSARAGMIRVKDLMDIPEDVRQGDKKIIGDGVALEVKNLSFAYAAIAPETGAAARSATERKSGGAKSGSAGGNDVLRGVNFRVEARERLGIMGETGCGKSTLAGLIARLYEFESGQILLNGTDIREMDPNNLRENVAYCTQNVQLLHGTLRENITLYDRRYADREIYGAIEKLNLTEWFSGFPNGLDTGLEMGENNLSAGEAQLVTLVRLALKNPKLVLLDEITSRLDAATERRLSSAVEALCRDRTVVLIAHSQAAVGWMDRILYMRNGRLYENPQDGQEGAGTAYESKQ